MALQLPADWSSYSPSEKIQYFNANSISESELKAAGVPSSDLSWMKDNGYTGKAKQTYTSTLPEVTYQTGAGDAPETVSQTKQETDYVNSKWNEIAAQAMGEPVYVYTGNMVNTGDGYENETVLNPAVAAKVQQLKSSGFDIVGGADNLNSSFQTYSLVNPQGQSVADWSESGSMKNLLKGVAPVVLAALTAGGAGGLLGSTVAPTASTALQGAIGGGLLGAGGAALTDNNILQGALLGGVGGYAAGGGFSDADALRAAQDADIAGGMVPEFGTNTAYDSFMSGAMTPAAQSAIEAQINQAAGMDNIDVGGGWSPATGGVDLSMGPQTAEQLGQGFQDYMAQSGYYPTGEVPEMVITANKPTSMTTPGSVWDVPSSIPDSVVTAPDQISTMDQITNPGFSSPLPALAGAGLTGSQIANLVKAGVTLAGLTGSTNVLGSPSGSTPFTAPTQTPPAYTSDYYQQLQKYYDTYMPQAPRDVTTPLQQWYSSKYGA